MKLKIITDSAADLPEEIIDKYELEVAPLLVTHDDHVYKDGITIKPGKLFDGMRNGKAYKTSQVTVGDFHNIFTRYARAKVDCLYIAFSSVLSGTYQSAILAYEQIKEEFPDFSLDIVDTKCASLGQGLVVYYAVRMVEAGHQKDEVIKAVKFYSQHMEHVFTVDDLEYLRRGGRVSKTAALVGGLLNIKPVLEVEEGKLIPIEKQRGRKKAIKRLVELMEERGEDINNQIIAISHGDDLAGVEILKEIIEEKFQVVDYLVNTIGAVIGAHAGPGTLALFFLNKQYQDQ